MAPLFTKSARRDLDEPSNNPKAIQDLLVRLLPFRYWWLPYLRKGLEGEDPPV
jgi:hypothetical protein